MNQIQIPKELKREGNFSFWLALLKESADICGIGQEDWVLDFGCGTGGFLRTFNELFPGRNLVGVEIDDNLLLECQRRVSSNGSFFNYRDIDCFGEGKIDIAYSQEVIYTIPDLSRHASDMYRFLRRGGYYFATMGCHIENPTWTKRRSRIRAEEKYPALDYSLDEVSKAFYSAGFRVSVMRLPVCSPLGVSFGQESEFSSVQDLLVSSHEHKILFVFMKPKYIARVE